MSDIAKAVGVALMTLDAKLNNNVLPADMTPELIDARATLKKFFASIHPNLQGVKTMENDRLVQLAREFQKSEEAKFSKQLAAIKSETLALTKERERRDRPILQALSLVELTKLVQNGTLPREDYNAELDRRKDETGPADDFEKQSHASLVAASAKAEYLAQENLTDLEKRQQNLAAELVSKMNTAHGQFDNETMNDNWSALVSLLGEDEAREYLVKSATTPKMSPAAKAKIELELLAKVDPDYAAGLELFNEHQAKLSKQHGSI